jgi:hypothetical protein
VTVTRADHAAHQLSLVQEILSDRETQVCPVKCRWIFRGGTVGFEFSYSGIVDLALGGKPLCLFPLVLWECQ